MLPIFSPNGMQHSLVISVFIGMLITSLMFERYGWVFSGLVVPGYLAPIFKIYPMSGLTILFEATVTALIVKGISNSAWRLRTHTPLFGRERFFAVVLTALVVRLVLEEFLLPYAVTTLFPGRTDILSRVRDFGAIGLVVVPLTANLLWKPGIPKGLMQVMFCTLATLAVLQVFLVPLTNYSLAQLGTVYEDVSLDFGASAKLQMFIIAGCLLAARMNLLEGWDFGGILLPPLIAISLLQPTRLIGTIAEVLLVVVVGRQVIKLPVLNRITWAGPRLVTFCFAVCVFIKFAAGWFFYLVQPQWNATDFMGFGYILSSLLAIKLWNKSSRTTLWPTLYVSAATFLVGTTLSFGLAAGARWLEPRPFSGGEGAPPPAESVPVEFAVLERLAPGLPGTGRERSVTTRRRMSEAAERSLAELRSGSTPEQVVAVAASQLAGTDATVRFIRPEGAPPYAMIGPANPETSDLETLFLRLAGGTRTLLITAPGAEPLPTFLATAALVKELQPALILLSNWDDPADLDSAPRFDSLVAWALRSFPMRPVLEVEGSEDPGASLDLYGSLPDDVLSVSDLKKVMPALQVHAPSPNAGRRMRWLSANGRGGYQRLKVDLPGASALLVALVPDAGKAGEALAPLEKYLGPYLEAMQLRKAGLTLTPEEWTKARLIVLKAGLLRLMATAQDASKSRPVTAEELTPMNFLARVLGLEIDLLEEPGGERRFLVLRNRLGELELDGLVVFTLGEWQELHVEVPSPRKFPNAHRLGTQIFLAGRCRALTIGGIGSPETGLLSASASGELDRMSMFHIGHQVLVERASVAGVPPPRVLQVRGRNLPEEGNDGILVPPDVALPDAVAEAAETAAWMRIFEELGWTIRIQPPDAENGYDIGAPLQARYRRFLRYEGISGLWADPDVRRALRGPKDDPAAIAAMRQLGCADGGTSLVALWRAAGYEPAKEVPVTVREALDGVAAYARTGNLAELAAGLEAARAAGWKDTVVMDVDAEVPLLVFETATGSEIVVVNLAATTVRGQELQPSGRAATLDALLRLRKFYLVGRRP
ncbi:MAG: poly-gamma-glutamate biosynthesis protein PgsC/CapC [Planctomycetes bacterium]|nr:poly-gamma-glutamate biosynthesis protein PgsC/CapC [Planctomycetota bacterium]